MPAHLLERQAQERKQPTRSKAKDATSALNLSDVLAQSDSFDRDG